MPNDRCAVISFPADTTIEIPTGSVLQFPNAPSVEVSGPVQVGIQEGAALTFPTGDPLTIKFPSPNRTAVEVQVDPTSGQITFPNRPAIELASLYEAGLGITFPPNSNVRSKAFKGQITFPEHFILRVGKKPR